MLIKVCQMSRIHPITFSLPPPYQSSMRGLNYAIWYLSGKNVLKVLVAKACWIWTYYIVAIIQPSGNMGPYQRPLFNFSEAHVLCMLGLPFYHRDTGPLNLLRKMTPITLIPYPPIYIPKSLNKYDLYEHVYMTHTASEMFVDLCRRHILLQRRFMNIIISFVIIFYIL